MPKGEGKDEKGENSQLRRLALLVIRSLRLQPFSAFGRFGFR
jgi:hypothetical protein